MNFDFTDDQQAIKRTAKDFLAARYKLEEVRRLALEDPRGFTDAQWGEIAELGWPGLAIAEEHGGLGLGVVELVVLQEELGYALAPTPFLSTVAAGLLLQAAGSEAQRAERLPALAAGEARATVAQWEPGGSHAPDEPALEPVGSALTGTKIAVPDAGSADWAIVTASEDRHFLVDLAQDGVTVEPQEALDPTRRLFSLHFDEAEAHRLPGDGHGVAAAYAGICAAIAAESVGVAQRALEMAVAYASDRKQFDRPIGAYQAVSHRCAQMLLEVEGGRSLAYYAGWACDHEPQTAPLAASMAKAYASDAGWRVTASSIQVHGGIGFTWEHDLHLFLKRAKANAHTFGDARWHRARVADLAAV
jgi:alkylation response protein AidB-like acyl-CoA dehydrogenase